MDFNPDKDGERSTLSQAINCLAPNTVLDAQQNDFDLSTVH
jgi:hypothetical protein